MNSKNVYESKDLLKFLEEDAQLKAQIETDLNLDHSSQNQKFKKLWYKAYRFNEPDSYYLLAFYYLFGIGTEKDQGMFIASLKKAANLKHIKGLLFIIKLYLFGIYLTYDENKVIEYLEKLLKSISDEDVSNYLNHILLLIYLYQKQDEYKLAAIGLIIKYKLVDKVYESTSIEVLGYSFEFDQVFKNEVKYQLQRIQKITKIKNKILKDDYEAIDEILDILNPDVPEDNYKYLLDIKAEINNAKSQKAKEQYKETIIRIINCITSFKCFTMENE